MVAEEPLVIVLQGEWDVYRCDELRVKLEAAYSAPDVILDLSGTTYVDSTCLGALVHLRKERSARGLPRAGLVISSPMVLRIFQIVRLDKAWPTYRSLEEALQASRD